ncbi:hypothetical protein DR192_01645 [Lawsonia intracellularis]|uniref:hypothetical protein n=1 Tax=Lawsonia intracellularis TaxID=29546 RepID=UPI000DE54F40|nr:hypothetical protein [Lawsonia intracellularis]RBN35061.1 hypothetical protein DR192_01645 [Lawsonia intracellularis]RBN35677.1 hypothetical protein DR193_01605 [Lawsonia intracellularis]UYH52583.1 hypothetical protein OCT60_04680 [Lawsonia intracellularis]
MKITTRVNQQLLTNDNHRQTKKIFDPWDDYWSKCKRLVITTGRIVACIISIGLSELLIKKIEKYKTQHRKHKARQKVFLHIYKNHCNIGLAKGNTSSTNKRK